MILRPTSALLAILCLSFESIFGEVKPYAAAAAVVPSFATSKQKRSEPISFPLRRRRRSSPTSPSKRSHSAEQLQAIRQHDLARYDTLLSRLLALYGDNSGGSNGRRTSWETLSLSSFDDDSFYYVRMEIGTPPQAFDITIDTGSSDLWVQSSTCRSCNLSLAEPYLDHTLNAFTASQSSTYQNAGTQVQTNYGDGSALEGTVSADVVTMGQFTVQQQAFILATQQNSDFGVAGLVGLAWPALAQTGGTPWWLNAISQFEQPEMSFYFAEWNANPYDDAAPGGQFTLGGRNTTLFVGDIQFVPLSSQDYWSVQLQAIIVNGGGPSKTLALSGEQYTDAIVDTGTTLMYGPTDVINSIFESISGAVQGQTIDRSLEGFWALPCSSTASVQFQFTSSAIVTIPATNLMYEEVGNGYCTATLLSSTTALALRRRLPPNSSMPAWVLGDIFLKSTYTVFRKGAQGEQPSVGFAPLSGVDYTQANGNAIIGAGGDGIDGRIGEAGVTIVGTGNGGGSGVGSSGVYGGAPSVTAGGNSPIRSGSTPNAALSNGWPILSVIAILAYFTASPELY